MTGRGTPDDITVGELWRRVDSLAADIQSLKRTMNGVGILVVASFVEALFRLLTKG